MRRADVVSLGRGLSIGPERLHPFLKNRTYINVALNGDHRERYEKIHAAKVEKVFRRWLENPSKQSPFDYHLTIKELDGILPPVKVESSGSIDERRCERCGQVKDRSQFYRSKSGPNGYSSVCRQCEAMTIDEATGSEGKLCGHCKKLKRFDQFYRCPNRAGGYSSWCRTCSLPQKKPPKAKSDEMIPEGSKRCSRCKQIKERNCFPRHSGTRDGLSFACFDCERERKKRRRAKTHAETIRNGNARPIGKGVSVTTVEFARRSRRVRHAMRDYLDARRRGESGNAELERWKVLDADLERAEDLAIAVRESEGGDA